MGYIAAQTQRLQLSTGSTLITTNDPVKIASVRPVSGDSRDVSFARTFADVAPGQPLLYEDSARRLSLAVNHGDASAWLPAGVDDEVWITPG